MVPVERSEGPDGRLTTDVVTLAPFTSIAAAEDDSSGVSRLVGGPLIGPFAEACGRGLEMGIARVPPRFLQAIGRTMHKVESGCLIESCGVQRQ